MAQSINNSGFITISDAFTKGFVGGYNQVFTPASYSNYLRNCRLENQGICMRDGFRVYSSYGELGEYMKLKATEKDLYGLVSINNVAHLFKLLPSGPVDLGIIPRTIPEEFSRCDLVAIGEGILVLVAGAKPYRYRDGDGFMQLPTNNLPSKDGGQTADRAFSSDSGVYYSGFVFINELDKDSFRPTNRVILSHEVNRDNTDRFKNAHNFSARRDADNLIIPYKIVCPSAVQAMVATQQNLYIFCQDSVQYLDKELLMEYAQNKTLRTLPLASGNRLMGKNMCVAAGNYVFFMCKDKHIRSLGYTQGIYDPQIADLTDTQFGIQKWINDNIAEYQPTGCAFFNKQDYTVEFHLKSRYSTEDRNDITLIRDLQHQQWLIDDGKSFSAMENFDRDRTASGESPFENSGVAHVVAGGGGRQGTNQFYYQSEAKYDSNLYHGEIEVNPIAFEYNTTNIALGEVAEQKLFNGVRLTGAINIHTGNTDEIFDLNTALFEVNVYVDGKQVCNKKLNRQQVYDTYQRLQIEVGGPETPEFDPYDRENVIKYNNYLFPIDLVLDQGMVRRKGKRIRVQIKSQTPGADLYLSGLSLRATPIGHFDLSDKF